MLSVIIPAYNEEQMIAITANTIHNLLNRAEIEHEIIFINDGSKDKTWLHIQQVSKAYNQIRGISFSRNFGKESAIFAGITEAIGDACVVIDCDLQHPPQKIIDMYRLWEQGYEVVEGVKSDRGKENSVYKLASHTFYQMISSATGIDMSNSSDFKLLDRKVMDILKMIPEKNIFFRAMSSWVGFRTAQVYYEVQERQAGETKWSTKALIKYAVTNITSFTTAPMQIVTILGILMFIGGVSLSILTIMSKLEGRAADGLTTVIILQCLIGSVIMTSIGIVGHYIAKIYEEVKRRPRYIIAERIGGYVTQNQ